MRWQQACRIVPTRYPSVYLYDRVADADDFDALYALEAMTNDRLRDETGEVELVPPEDRVFGPGSGPIMAAFTHVNPLGSRFSDGSYGVFYAARERATAVAETRLPPRPLPRRHAARAPMHLPMRLYHVAIDARLHDLRPTGAVVPPAVFDPDDYAASRALGAAAARAPARPAWSTAACAARRGHCVGLFKPRGASACVQAAYLLYAWDGERFTDIYEKIEHEHRGRAERFDRLDALRGVAIVWMALFHFALRPQPLRPARAARRTSTATRSGPCSAPCIVTPVPVLRRPVAGAWRWTPASAGRASGAAGRRSRLCACWSVGRLGADVPAAAGSASACCTASR